MAPSKKDNKDDLKRFQVRLSPDLYHKLKQLMTYYDDCASLNDAVGRSIDESFKKHKAQIVENLKNLD